MTNSESPNLRVGKHLSGFQMPVCGLAASEAPGQDLAPGWPSHYFGGREGKRLKKIPNPEMFSSRL